MSTQSTGCACIVRTMRREVFDSTAIASAGYDADTAVLEIEFGSGGVYRYLLVPPRVWRELREAESPGRYFAESVRGRFPEEWVP
ncbi:KTSC domain-containing protein [Leifsonia shinshuensis]|uniref:KTSC domain-containing protein n=1 Tax=Leifsonia shinshuensis TaxID=150026 RepID=A0A853CWU0_9MICO|nr:hypothetical protein [Leifsonia shinshuensis]